jgi:hypothetical protein
LAATTPIAGGGGAGEPSAWNVINWLLTGTNAGPATVANVNQTAVPITPGLRRVDDSIDQFYQDGVVPVSVEGLYFGNAALNSPFAGATHDLYYENETTGAAAVQAVAGAGDAVSGTQDGSITVGIGQVFSLTAVRGGLFFDGTQNNVGPQYASSIESENVGGLSNGTTDRMVTFEIDVSQINTLFALDDGTGSTTFNLPNVGSGLAYLHFFDTGSDSDYQDAVYLTIGARAIPLPMPGALAAAGVGLVALRRARG